MVKMEVQQPDEYLFCELKRDPKDTTEDQDTMSVLLKFYLQKVMTKILKPGLADKKRGTSRKNRRKQ